MSLPPNKDLILPPLPAEIFELVGFDWNGGSDALQGFDLFPDHSEKVFKRDIVSGYGLPSVQYPAGVDNPLICFFRRHGGNRAAGGLSRQGGGKWTT